MSTCNSGQPRFSVRTGQLIRRCLRSCRYREDLVVENYALSSERTLPFVAFAHRPHDARSSCIAFLTQSRTPRTDVESLRELGVPLVFVAGDDGWEMWSLRGDGSRRERAMRTEEVEAFFEAHKSDFAPGAVFRAKTWARAAGTRQLDFVDAGFLPLVEQEAGVRLRQLFEDMVAHTMDALGLRSSRLSEADAHWLTKANFWLLAGKLLRDKQVPKFVRLDLNEVQDVFDRVAEHYGAQRVRSNGRLTALRGAAAVAANFSSFRTISTETLGALYEEALLTERTRKLLSVHRTPTYLVDYMLAKLSGWIEEEIGVENCRIFEPACGHAPFLVGSVRLLSDLLPENTASNRSARQRFLREHISGCDRDAFALEIARLSLTLADIPNPNGWQLDAVDDMFDYDYLQRNISAASVVCVNPPFESARITAQERANGDLRFHRNGQAAELLRRVIQFSEPGTALGMVVPQSILKNKWFTALRRDFLEQFDVQEITVFPDKVFEFADVESSIVIARKRAPSARPASDFLFRRVREGAMTGFIEKYAASENVRESAEGIRETKDAQLLVPRLAALWSTDKDWLPFSNIARIAHGLFFLPRTHKDFPRGAITTSEKESEGLKEGYATARGAWETHLSPPTVWFNLDSKVIEWPMEGTTLNLPQVLMNHGLASRAAWRHKAFIDQAGRPFTHRFIVLRPYEGASPELLWALCNSPYANAYTSTDASKRDISATFLREMPVPRTGRGQLAPLESAVRTYLKAAREFSTAEIRNSKTEHKPDTKAESKRTRNKEQMLLLGLGGNGPKIELLRDQLRALHWRVDAEVLKLYSLPPALERELLDFFDGARRVGVPFEQTQYIPLEFREVQRLDDFLCITDEWEQTDERRCELIEKQIKHGRRTPSEEAEFQELQRLYDLRRSYQRWLRTGDANSPLFDEAKLRRLKEADALHPQHE